MTSLLHRGTKYCIIIQKLKFEDYNSCLKNNKQFQNHSTKLNLFTEKTNKIAFGTEEDNRLQTSGEVATYHNSMSWRKKRKNRIE